MGARRARSQAPEPTRFGAWTAAVGDRDGHDCRRGGALGALRTRPSQARHSTSEVEPLPWTARCGRWTTPVNPLGGVTTEARARSGGGAARGVVDVLHGRRPANLVNALVDVGRRASGRLPVPSSWDRFPALGRHAAAIERREPD